MIGGSLYTFFWLTLGFTNKIIYFYQFEQNFEPSLRFSISEKTVFHYHEKRKIFFFMFTAFLKNFCSTTRFMGNSELSCIIWNYTVKDIHFGFIYPETFVGKYLLDDWWLDLVYLADSCLCILRPLRWLVCWQTLQDACWLVGLDRFIPIHDMPG